MYFLKSLIISLVFGIIAYAIGKKKTKYAFLLGFFLSVFGVAIVIFMEDVKEECCTNCGEKVSSDAKLCYKCGVDPKKVLAPKFCKYCGSEITSEQVICTQCKKEIIRFQEGASVGAKLASLFIPLVGIIIYATNVSTKKRYANECLFYSLIPVFIGIVFAICWCVL